MSSVSSVEKEINKFLKKIKVISPKEQVELHNVIGGLYSEIGLYEEAQNHHEKARDLCKGLGDSLGVAVAYRHIGEAKAACSSFDEAIEDVTKYLQLTRKCNNEIEYQRALTTLGRVQLMQAQHMKDERYYHSDIKRVALKAEKTFHKALTQTRDIKSQIDIKEFNQMYAGLLVNMGLVKELCGKRDETIKTLREARDIYKGSRLKEELFRCLVLLSSINRQAKDMKQACLYGKEALDTAKGIGKKLLLCEAFLEMGLNHITLRQFTEAKRAFRCAHREGTPNEEDLAKAIRFRKISHLISNTFDKLNQESMSSAVRAKYAERIGDLLCKLDCYCQGIIYYGIALNNGRVCQMPKEELAKILYSLAETYSDDGQLVKALKCFEKELDWSRAEKAKCQTMLRIAQIMDQLDREQAAVCQAYERVLQKSDNHLALKQTILENYTAYMKEKNCNVVRYNEIVKMKQSVDDFYAAAAIDDDDENVSSQNQENNEDDEDQLEEEITQLDVQDFESDDDENDEVLMLSRRRGLNKIKHKINEFGETPLHEAIIRGDTKRVRQLLSQGYDVNPKDNLGWTPLHEACNHGHYEIAQMLIEKGADVSVSGPKGMTPLHDAAANGHFDVMKLLMKNDANVVALTANGESVLKCLRDYRRRFDGKMSNLNLSDYKETETDLLDLMDKRGFDLISTNVSTNESSEWDKDEEFLRKTPRSTADYQQQREILKKRKLQHDQRLQQHQQQKQQQRQFQDDRRGTYMDIGSSTTANLRRPTHESDRYKSVQRESQSDEPYKQVDTPRPKPKSNMATLDIDTEIVRDYRATLGHLKRKHRSPESTLDSLATKRVNPDVTYEAEFNPSTSTKDWLIDDVTKPSRRNQKFNMIVSDDEEDDGLEAEFGGDNAGDLDFDKSDCENSKTFSDRERSGHEKAKSSKKTEATRAQAQAQEEEVITLSDDDYDPLPEFISPQRPCRSDDFNIGPSPDLGRDSPTSFSPYPSNGNRRIDQVSTITSTETRKDKSIIYVHVEGKKLMIQIQNPGMSIKWLKEAIVERYDALVGDSPNISIAPMNDPDCIVSDKDTCELFLGDHIIAKITSWNLDTIDNTYKSHCSKMNPNLKPLNFVIHHLAPSESSDKLDLTYTRLPNSHVEPFTRALTKRSYQSVKLNGTTCLFRPNYSELILTAIASWDQLVHLELRCVGLIRAHFEHLCSKLTLKNLKVMNLSHNCVVYKCTDEFRKYLESLLSNNPKLSRLDLSHNQLKFLSNLPLVTDAGDKLVNQIPSLGFPDKFADFELITNAQNDQYPVVQMEY